MNFSNNTKYLKTNEAQNKKEIKYKVKNENNEVQFKLLGLFL